MSDAPDTGPRRAMNGPAFRVDGRVVARDRFYAAACDPARSCVVEACAGSGKTWMLVARMLRALLEGAEPHELLAITFTRAAAGEMRQRLGEWVARWAAPRSSHAERVAALEERGLDAERAELLAPRLGGLQARLLGHGRPVEIRTFHAWFSQLLRSAPLELLDGLGLQPDMTLVEDIDEHRLAVFRAFHAAVLRDAGLSEDFRALTAERGRSQVGKWLQAAWHRRVEIELADEAGVLDQSVVAASAVWPELARVADPAEVIHEAEWRHRLGALSARLARGRPLSQKAGAALQKAIDTTDAREAFATAWLALHTVEGKPRKNLDPSPLLDETYEALTLLAAQIAQQDAHAEHRRMARLARVLLAEYAVYKRTRGLADMADLERCALALLRDGELSGWVQERLDTRVRHLFIDEFQDTSPLQWHALHAWLSAYAGAGGGASGQRPPSVFMVGDPKQSLYRFRGAEPRVFEEAARFVVDGLAGQRLACDHTRRNAPAIVAAINAVFTAAEAEGAFAGFRPHTTEVEPTPGDAVQSIGRTDRPSKAARQAAAEPVWRDSLLVPREAAEELLREHEAGRVATGIAKLAGHRVGGAQSIHVLARRRQSLRFAAAALQGARVAHGPVEDGVLMESPEAQDLVALLDVLVSPQHALSLARALKSPLFGASDDDLIAIADAGGTPAGWWAALQRLARPSAALMRARTLLADWAEAARRLPPHDLLDRIVDESDLKARLLAAVPAEQRPMALDAIDAVLAQSLMLDGARYATPYGFVRALKRRVVKALAPLRADAVRLMTIHGAKGLEADTVFVMDADPEAPRTAMTTLLIDWPVESERPARCAFVYSEARCPPSLAGLLAVEMQAREREAMNALYVAMTRARHRLVFSATAPLLPGAGASWWQRLAPVAVACLPEPIEVAADAPAVDTVVATLKLPPWQRATVAASPGVAASRREDAAASLGRAVHRVLEWAADTAGEGALPDLAAAAAREFDTNPAAVERSARAVLDSADCRRFFDPRGLLWSGSEVPVAEGGQVLRIDRLVLLAGAPPTWWVLDYKLHHTPESLAAYREQLLRYAAAVAQGEPGATVRCAFITGRGELVEVTRLPQYRTNGSLFDA